MRIADSSEYIETFNFLWLVSLENGKRLILVWFSGNVRCCRLDRMGLVGRKILAWMMNMKQKTIKPHSYQMGFFFGCEWCDHNSTTTLWLARFALFPRCLLMLTDVKIIIVIIIRACADFTHATYTETHDKRHR